MSFCTPRSNTDSDPDGRTWLMPFPLSNLKCTSSCHVKSSHPAQLVTSGLFQKGVNGHRGVIFCGHLLSPASTRGHPPRRRWRCLLCPPQPLPCGAPGFPDWGLLPALNLVSPSASFHLCASDSVVWVGLDPESFETRQVEGTWSWRRLLVREAVGGSASSEDWDSIKDKLRQSSWGPPSWDPHSFRDCSLDCRYWKRSARTPGPTFSGAPSSGTAFKYKRDAAQGVPFA